MVGLESRFIPPVSVGELGLIGELGLLGKLGLIGFRLGSTVITTVDSDVDGILAGRFGIAATAREAGPKTSAEPLELIGRSCPTGGDNAGAAFTLAGGGGGAAALASLAVALAGAASTSVIIMRRRASSCASSLVGPVPEATSGDS